jgi:retron-type reverse transcriptase
LGNLTTPSSVQKLQRALHAKAKAQPEFRFYALYDKVWRADILEHAYRCCKANKGAAGVDEQEFADVEAYGVERWLGELAQALREQKYRPEAVRRVYIKKRNGKLRPLGIPTLRDRVCKTAAMLVLEPIFEADLPPEQYAYRAATGALDAVRQVHRLINTGHREVVDADLSGYFDSIPHAELMTSVARRVVDRRLLHLIKMWLEAPVEETDERGRKSRSTANRDQGRGIPQGSPITPLTQKIICFRAVVDDNHLGRSHCLTDFATRGGPLPHYTCYRFGRKRKEARMSTISTQTRRELVNAIRDRYQAGSSADKGRILDEFVKLTGYHRKHAIRVLGSSSSEPSLRSPRSRLYDEAVREALVLLWEASDRICGKRLKPLLPILLPALEKHGHMCLDETVRERLLAASAATVDRLLASRRATAQSRRKPRARPRASQSIPVRTFADWKQPPPGFVEIDLVAHCGDSLEGSFAYTLVLTDIASGWTECVALLVREGALVADALDRLRTTMPFPLRGIDSDNGSEFINDTLLAYCGRLAIEFTRSRPHRKNDQAWVEQKNGSVVRRLVGHGRLQGLRAVEALARLYSAARLFVNFFQPSFKLADKNRVGSRIRKRYHPPKTPCARLLASPSIDEGMKERLLAVLATLDPLRLLDEIRTVQQHLAGLARGEVLHVLPHRDADLDRFLLSLATAWKDGEVRPTHRAGPKPKRHWRTRPDPFEAVWPRVVTWLETEPDRTAKELLERLQAQGAACSQRQLRTLQRRVKAWRSLAARRLVFMAPTRSLEPAPPAAPADEHETLAEA